MVITRHKEKKRALRNVIKNYFLAFELDIITLVIRIIAINEQKQEKKAN